MSITSAEFPEAPEPRVDSRAGALPAALAEHQSLLRALLDATSDAVFVKDAAGRYLLVNDLAAQALARPAGDVIGHTDADLQPPAAAAALRAVDERVWRTGLTEEGEELVLHDGEPHLFRTRKSVVRSAAGEPVALLGVARDVTERRHASDATARLAAIVGSSADAIISKSIDGTILTWNAAAERLLGWTAREAIGRPITLVIPPELHAEETEIIRRLTAGERIEHYQTTRVRRDGTRLTVSLSIAPIRDASGRVVMASKILRDVTREREAAAERERLLEAERAARVEAERMQALLEDQAVQLEAQEVELEATIDELREANEALTVERAGAERARQLLDAVVAQLPVGVYVAEAPTGRIVLRNNKAEELLGHPAIAADDTSAYVRFGAEHLDGTPYRPGEHALARALEGETVDQRELRYRRPDGTVVELSASAAPVRNAEGRIGLAVSTFLDVTARRAAQRALAEREALLDGFFRTPGLMMLVLDEVDAAALEHRVVLANPAAAALLGMTPEAITGRTTTSLGVPEHARRMLAELFARVRATDAPVTIEAPSVQRPGHWFQMVVSPIAVTDHGANRYAELLFDVTEERHAEAQRRRLELLVAHSTDCILVADPSLALEFINPAGATLLGAASSDALLGTPALTLVHDDARWQMDEEVLPALQAHGRWEGETMLRHLATDAPVPVEMTAFGITDPASGETIAYASVSRPIGERRRLQAELLQSQKMEVVGRLAGGVAHDFNNLLTVIGTSADFLLADLAPDDPRRDDVAAVAAAAERSATLTRQLLAFSRRQVSQPRAFDVNELASRTDRMLRRLVGEDVAMTLALGSAVPWAIADPGQVEQALLNLVVNARDAMPNGGALTIATGTLELDDAYAAAHPGARAGRYVTLSVIDTGTGMDAPTMARLFEPFFTTKDVGKGTGLGLSTVRAIIERAGGTVLVHSQPAGGSTFTLCLPYAHEHATAVAAVLPAMPRGTETVLLVDDDASVRRAARRVLVGQGYVVLEAAHHDEALAIARSHQGAIDLVLTDVVLPGLGGGAVADAVRAFHPEAAVMFMSGYTADAVVRHRVDAGVPFIEKPFTVAGLAARVREALDAR